MGNDEMSNEENGLRGNNLGKMSITNRNGYQSKGVLGINGEQAECKWRLGEMSTGKQQAPGQISFEANRRCGKWAPKQRGTRSKWAHGKSGTRALRAYQITQYAPSARLLQCPSALMPVSTGTHLPQVPIFYWCRFATVPILPKCLFGSVPISPKCLLVPYGPMQSHIRSDLIP